MAQDFTWGRLFVWISVSIVFFSVPAGTWAEDRVTLPDGFQLTQVATDDLATNIFCMLALTDGGVLVSGPGYIKKLVDTNDDLVFDRADLVADFPKSGAQGMAVDGNDLLCVGDGGIWRLQGVLSGEELDPRQVHQSATRLFEISTRGEHHAHSIQRGPDGWWYHIAGNHAVFDEESCDGPISNRRAGVVIRFSPDFSQRQIMAHGFRNAYDFAFNSTDQLFTFDSDGERDLGLPWYRPTRVFEIVPGDDAGWVSKTWKRPSYYFDMPRLIGDAGRASPTGVVCYNGHQFPIEYDDSIFLGDWTFGRVLVCKRVWKTGEYLPPEEFLAPKESFGFPVTDLSIASDGSLLVSVGGRGTQGGVWRVASKIKRKQRDEPLGQYIWDCWIAFRQGESFESTIEAVFEGISQGNSLQRTDALAKLLVHAQALNVTQHGNDLTVKLEEVLNSDEPKVLAAAFRLIEAVAEDEAWRSHWLNREPEQRLSYRFQVLAGIATAKTDTERSIVFKSLFAPDRPSFAADVDKPFSEEITCRLALILLGGVGGCDGVFASTTANDPIEWSADQSRNAHKLLSMRAMTKGLSAQAKREIVRVAAAQQLRTEMLYPRLLDEINGETPVEDDLHRIICMVRLQRNRPDRVTARLASVLLNLQKKVSSQNVKTDSHWRPILSELIAEAFEKFPGLTYAFLCNSRFGDAEHGFLFDEIANDDLPWLQSRIVSWIGKNCSRATEDHVRVLARNQNPMALDSLRMLKENHALKDAVTMALAKHGNASDRELFAEGLQSLDPKVQKESAIALRKLVPEVSADVAAAALSAAMRLGNEKQDVSIRDQLVLLLRKFAGKDFGYQMNSPDVRQGDVLVQWRTFMIDRHPELAKMLKPAESGQQLMARLEKLDWNRGRADRGKRVYEKLQCAACHGAGRALGPRLEGVTRRLGQSDLLTAIVTPDAQVSDRYRATLFETVDGQLFSGSVIYENVDGVTIRESIGQTFRLNRDQIEQQRRSGKSLMPTGLLDRATEQEVTDLMAYLKTL